MRVYQPRLSIGMPVYNGERYVRFALDSLLAQTFTDFELIISDNASTDGTPDICQEYAKRDPRIRYFRNDQNLGASRNYNLVFERSSGEYFKWATHDDVVAPNFLKQCIDVLNQDPGVILCYSGTGKIDEEGNVIGMYESRIQANLPNPDERFLDLVLVRHPCTAIFGVARRTVLQKTPLIGSYVGSDRNLLAELGLLGRLYEIPEPLFFRRDHSQASISKYGLHERLEWFDSKKKDHIHFPHWRAGFEYVRSVLRVPLRWSERRECLRIVAFWMFKREREELVEDLTLASQRLGMNDRKK